jgi:hypothetical protein
LGGDPLKVEINSTFTKAEVETNKKFLLEIGLERANCENFSQNRWRGRFSFELISRFGWVDEKNRENFSNFFLVTLVSYKKFLPASTLDRFYFELISTFSPTGQKNVKTFQTCIGSPVFLIKNLYQ